MYYKVGLVIEENTFSEGALKYEITPNNGEVIPTGQVLNKLTGNVPQTGTEWFGMGYFVPSPDAVVHKYSLKISFPETGKNQNIDKGKHFAGYVTITDEGEFVNLNVIVDSETPELNYNLRLLKNSGIFLETPVKDGKVFKEWNVVSGNATVESNKLIVREEDVVVEAIWEKTTRYITLIIDLDGGTSSTIQLSQSVLANSSVVLDIPTMDGYIFSNWQVIVGEAFVYGNTILLAEQNVVLKAVWKDVLPVFTYLKSDGRAANYTITKENVNDWKIKFLESGTLIFSELGSAKDGIDVFLVGGGAGGAVSTTYAMGAGGGGSGEVLTEKNILLREEYYDINIGFGGNSNSTGGSTTAFSFTVSGGNPGSQTSGGSGGSGGGGGGYSNDYNAGTGGQFGNNGNDSANGWKGGAGKGITTCEFGEGTLLACYEGVTLYASGGSGGTGQRSTGEVGPSIAGVSAGAGAGGSGSAGKNALDNTGSGGGGGGYNGYAGGKGGSGIVIIRNTRS